MDEIPIPTPKQVEDAAERRSLTIAQMCRRADIDPQTFHRWKAGKGMPTLASIQRMKDAIEREPITKTD